MEIIALHVVAVIICPKMIKTFLTFCVRCFYLLLRSFENSKANEMQKMHIFRGNKINHHHHHRYERIVSNTCNALEFFHCGIQYTVCVCVQCAITWEKNSIFWFVHESVQVSNPIYHLRKIIPLIPLHHLSFTLFLSLSLVFFDAVQRLCEIFLLHMLHISNSVLFCYLLVLRQKRSKCVEIDLSNAKWNNITSYPCVGIELEAKGKNRREWMKRIWFSRWA